MVHAYYPGCSLHATGLAYDESVRAVAEVLGLELEEIPDWNCCGATAVHNVGHGVALVLSARNLALASRDAADVVVPCSACYTNLLKAKKRLDEDARAREEVSAAMAEAGVSYRGDIAVRHLLEVVADDVGPARLRETVERPLTGLRVAPYYGCQIVRPLGLADDPDHPVKLHRVLEAVGAEVVDYPMMTCCCGGSLAATQNDVALRLCRDLLRCAKRAEADAVAVACPLCQLNLDAYQRRINRTFDLDLQIPVVFFTQLLGAAFGLDEGVLGLARSIVPLRALEGVQGR
jgi:heterodisulfide reductase subunit B